MDWKLELVAIPVSDVDRAKAFYTEKVGFNADHDHRVDAELRFVQLTPPGSACSISFGEGITDAAPGSVQGLQLVVSDINIARASLRERGVLEGRGHVGAAYAQRLERLDQRPGALRGDAQRHVHGRKAERGEGRVVQPRREGVPERPAHHAVERGAGLNPRHAPRGPGPFRRSAR